MPSANVGRAVLTMAVSRVAMPIPNERAITAGKRLLEGNPSATEDMNNPALVTKALRVRADADFFSGQLPGCQSFHVCHRQRRGEPAHHEVRHDCGERACP